MTDVVMPKPSPVAGLRSAFAKAGYPLRVNRFPEGGVYGVWTPHYAAIVRDRDRRPIRGQPTEWNVQIRPVRNHRCDGEPVVEHRFHRDEDPRWIASVVLGELRQLEEPERPTPPPPVVRPAPVPAPVPPLPDVRPDRRPTAPAPRRAAYQFTRRETPVVWPAVGDRPKRTPRTRKVRVAYMRRRGVRPGRYAHTSWSRELHVQLGKVEKPRRDVRVWPVLAAAQPIGWVAAAPVPRPGGRIRRSRTLWRAYYIGEPSTDLTGRGRESREGAIAVLVAHWQRCTRPIGAGR
jgi:hypothetical protein